MINLDYNTITLKESVNQQKEASSASVSLIGTFIPQENNTKAARNASTSKASLKPTPENFSFFPKNKSCTESVFLDISAHYCAPVRNNSQRRK